MFNTSRAALIRTFSADDMLALDSKNDGGSQRRECLQLYPYFTWKLMAIFPESKRSDL